MMKKETGFFVKYGDARYSPAHEKLSQARADARSKGPNLEIYHGELIRINDEIIDDKNLFLVVKVRKQ